MNDLQFPSPPNPEHSTDHQEIDYDMTCALIITKKYLLESFPNLYRKMGIKIKSESLGFQEVSLDGNKSWKNINHLSISIKLDKWRWRIPILCVEKYENLIGIEGLHPIMNHWLDSIRENISKLINKRKINVYDKVTYSSDNLYTCESYVDEDNCLVIDPIVGHPSQAMKFGIDNAEAIIKSLKAQLEKMRQQEQLKVHEESIGDIMNEHHEPE